MSVSVSDGAEKLSVLAEELSGNDPELGAKMLLLAAAALAESRATYLEAARRPSRTPANLLINSRWRPPARHDPACCQRAPVPGRATGRTGGPSGTSRRAGDAGRVTHPTI
jgi:hypothetical protein